MANNAGTIIDSFLVEIGLDPKNYEEGRKKIVEDNKRLRDDSTKSAKTLEANAKKSLGGITALRGEVLRLTLAFAGAASITSFAQNMIKSDAATGRLAGNMGMLTGELSAWEGAIQRVGGKAGEADDALRTMSRAWWDFQLTGKTANDADLKGLGVTPKDLQNPADALLKIAEASEKMGRPEFVARLQRIGFSESTINLLQKGRKEVEGLLDEQRKLAPVTEENARKAAELEASIAKLKTIIEGKARPVIAELVELMVGLADGSEDAEKKMSDFGEILIPIAVLAGLAGAPFIALAAAIGAVALKWKELKGAWNDITEKFGSQTAHDWFYSGPMQRDKKTSGAGHSIGGRSQWSIPSASEGAAAQSAAKGRAAPNMRGMNNRILNTGSGGTDPEIYKVLAAKYGPEVAAGITAGIKAEGGSLGMAANGAFGIGQWRGQRQRELFKRYGRAPTKQQQLEFLMWELEGGDQGGASVLASKDRHSALSNYIGGYGWGFMRPSTKTDNSGRIGDMRRGSAALRSLEGRHPSPAGTNVNIGTMNINTRATSADGIARDINASIGRRVTINQVNGGLS